MYLGKLPLETGAHGGGGNMAVTCKSSMSVWLPVIHQLKEQHVLPLAKKTHRARRKISIFNGHQTTIINAGRSSTKGSITT